MLRLEEYAGRAERDNHVRHGGNYDILTISRLSLCHRPILIFRYFGGWIYRQAPLTTTDLIDPLDERFSFSPSFAKASPLLQFSRPCPAVAVAARAAFRVSRRS